jgi:predicted Zn finger-like uncharacterized protein
MDIRCPSCSKLFRVADEKIAGKGIRFKCSKCAEVITITKDNFEMDLLARESEPKTPAAAQAPALKPQPVPEPQQAAPAPQPVPEPEAQEYKPQEYQPLQAGTDEDNPSESQQSPQTALSDFDFSEPHAAAASAAHPAEGFGGEDFFYNAPSHGEEDAVPEISVSPEAAAEAEAALDFSADLISEPKRKPAFGAPSPSAPAEPAADEQEHDLETTLAIPKETAAEPEPAATMQESVLDVAQALPKGPVITPELLAQMKRRTTTGQPAAQTTRTTSANEDIDLGAALRIPQTFAAAGELENGQAAGKTLSAAKEAAQPSGTVEQHEIHPFASGTMTGAVAGLGCAVPLIALMVAGFGMVAKLMPFSVDMSLFHLAVLLGSSIISMTIMIGVMISLVQARAGKKLFFLVNILIGTVFGAAFGVGESAILSLVTGTELNAQILMLNAMMAGVASFVLSILVVIARRLMVNEKDETFSVDLSGAQKAGIALALGIVLLAVYQNGSYSASMEQAAKDVRQKPSAAIKPLTITAAGLQIANAHGYIDPVTGDLIVSGAVQNTTDKPRSGWYLVTEVRDAKEAVLATAKMVNGVQLYSKVEQDVLSKRGEKIEDIQKKISALGEGTIPAKGSITFEVRVLNPPAGSARFLPTLQSLDPAALVSAIQAGQGRQ